MFDRKVSGGLASPRRPYLWYSSQGFSQHFWSFYDTRSLGHAIQRRAPAPLRRSCHLAHRAPRCLARPLPADPSVPTGTNVMKTYAADYYEHAPRSVVKRVPRLAAPLGSRVLRTWRSERAKNLTPRQPSHSCSPLLDLLTKKPPVLSGSRLQHN